MDYMNHDKTKLHDGCKYYMDAMIQNSTKGTWNSGTVTSRYSYAQ